MIPVFYDLVVHKTSGASVPEETMQTWDSIAKSIKIADDVLDLGGKDEYSATAADSLGFLSNDPDSNPQDPILKEALTRVRGELDKLRERDKQDKLDELGESDALNEPPEDRGEVFINDLSRLVAVDRKLRATKDRKDFTQLSLLKGQITARLFIDTLPLSIRTRPDYNELHRQIRLTGRGGSLFDMFLDHPIDYKLGLVSLKPTIKNRLEVFASGLPTAVDVMVRGVGRKLVKELVTVGVGTKLHSRDDLIETPKR